jgi:glucosamine 6-phosphate synthetase-like amidotransferase/phosphosugar isomerase protein
MCGVFGYITRDGEGPDIKRLQRIALVTQSRGDHAFGLAWIDADGKLGIFKQPGPARDWLDELDRCRNAVAMIGHCRWATHGSHLDNRNNHPHTAGRGWLVHNGVVHNYRALADQFQLSLKTQCDSEVLGLLMAHYPGALIQRSAWAANQVRGDLAILGLWRKPARLLVVRRGKPLHVGQGRDGCYFASLPEGLPGKAQLLPDCMTRVLSYGASA